MTTTYLINRSRSTPLDGDVPQRVWTGKDVSYRHLKVFDCLSYIHVAKDKRGKLDPKTRPCIFLGYGDDEFDYCHDMARLEPMTLCYMERALDHYTIYCNT